MTVGKRPVTTRRRSPQTWCEVDQVGGCAVVTAGGEFDLHTAPTLGDAGKVAAEFSSWVIVDLTNVTFLDSSGLEELLRTRRHAEAKKGQVALAGAEGPVRSVLELTRLDHVFSIHDHLEAAIFSLHEARTNSPSVRALHQPHAWRDCSST
jgi:anti-sigma B factor antagonist